MGYVQLVSPDFSTVGRMGYCLEYAENVCGSPHLEANAYIAGQNTEFKHYDSNFPSDVICIQWYEYWLNGTRLDHVTINVPGKGIYSSPWQSGTSHAVLPSISEVERIYGVKYLFWSEDISTLRVIKAGEPVMNKGDVYNYFVTIVGHEPTDADYAAWVGQDHKTFLYDKAIPEVKARQVNHGDLVNVFGPLLGHPPSADDEAAWDGKEFKDFTYNKLIPEIKNRVK